MSVTATDFQNLIITSLSDGDPTVLAGLQRNVPLYWTLYNRQSVIPELQYFYARREAIRYCMASVTRQIDFARRNQGASRAMTASSLSNDSMTATASESATSLANRSSSSNYSDATNSSGTGSSVSNRSAAQTMGANASMSDTGSGSNSASQSSAMTSSSTVNASSCDSMAANGRGVSDTSGYHQRENLSEKDGVGAGIGVSASVTVSWTGEHETGAIQNINSADRASQYIARQNDVRSNTMSQAAAQSSSSHFNANRVSSDTMSASGYSVMTSSSSSSFSMSGSGSGTMSGTGVGGSSMVASSSRIATARGEAHRLATSQSATTSTMERLHQRFLHLQDLWEKANEMIAWFEKQRLGLTPYAIRTITIQYPEGLNADAANLYLVKTPFGIGNGR